MSLQPRHKLLLGIAVAIFIFHLVMAVFSKPTYAFTMFGDALPCALLIVAILAVRENFRYAHGVLPLFWKVIAAGLTQFLLSQVYWFYYDTLHLTSSPSPVIGDTLFLLANVLFLSSFVLRPHSASAGGDMRLRHLDFTLLTFWWLALYGYFALPWQSVIKDMAQYTPNYYVLEFIQQLMIILSLAVVWRKREGLWRWFYAGFTLLFVLLGAGSLFVSVAIERGFYVAGGFFDTPFLLSLLMFTGIAALGPGLQPVQDKTSDREIKQNMWTARVAMVAILTLPVIALFGSFEFNVPAKVAAFRLQLVFVAMFLLSVLVFWKLTLLTRELGHLVHLSRASLENLKTVKAQVTHSEKLAALGRLAAGATHEISNPLTAILGYSELLADIPALSPSDRESAQIIQKQVHCAQAAVNSLRNSLRNSSPAHPNLLGKQPES
jgi:signal transduction histidine kinase